MTASEQQPRKAEVPLEGWVLAENPPPAKAKKAGGAVMVGVVVAGVTLGLVASLLLPADWLLVPQESSGQEGQAKEHSGPKEYYACPMFCTRLDKPGNCPVCGMTMEKFVDTGGKLALPLQERQKLGLRAEPIERRKLAREIRTLGVFQADETREKVVSAWIDGRIERVYADFTGIPVEKGWHLYDLYSEKLYSAQKELLVARDAAAKPGLSEVARKDAGRLLELAREKLLLLGLTDEQVEFLEAQAEPSLMVTIPAPDSGVVTQKLASPGMYVKQGQPVYRISDLSTLWLMVEVHERDLSWIALGQEVDAEVRAFPGTRFSGLVGFVDPVLDEKTRTVRVRVEVPNDEGLLKPGMYGNAVVFSELSSRAMLAAPELEGDYACPMHPLQRSNSPGKCAVCGMEMTRQAAQHGDAPGMVWAVPREAVLSTGRRHLVYVEWWVRIPPHDEHSGDEPPPVVMLEVPEYQGFEVELGPLAAAYHIDEHGNRHKLGEYYPLLSGIPTGIPDHHNGRPGIRIVTNAQFLIDSQMELTGKPSLLRPKGGEQADPHAGH